MIKLQKLLYSLILIYGTAFLSAFFTQEGTSGWYQIAVKSALTPPDYVFPIVWNLLYLSLVICLYTLLQFPNTKPRRKAHESMLIQLILQILWCFSFFYKAELAWGLTILILMCFTCYKMIKQFSKLNHYYTYALSPYFLWLCYATLLNLLFVINNGIIFNI